MPCAVSRQRCGATGPVLVTVGDAPLIRAETLGGCSPRTPFPHARAPFCSAFPPTRPGSGGPIRDAGGHVLRIVEEARSPAGRAGAAGVQRRDLRVRRRPALARPRPAYVPPTLRASTTSPTSSSCSPGRSRRWSRPIPTRSSGVNDRRQLAAAEAVLRRRTLDALMLSGVTVEDPSTTYIDPRSSWGRTACIHPMTTLRGATTLGSGCEIGPMAHARATCRAGDRVVVGASHLEECELGDEVRDRAPTAEFVRIPCWRPG